MAVLVFKSVEMKRFNKSDNSIFELSIYLMKLADQKAM